MEYPETATPIVHLIHPIGRSEDWPDHYAVLIEYSDGSRMPGFQPMSLIRDLQDRHVLSPACDDHAVISYHYWLDPVAAEYWHMLMFDHEAFDRQQHEDFGEPLPDPSIPMTWELAGITTHPEEGARVNMTGIKAHSESMPVEAFDSLDRAELRAGLESMLDQILGRAL